MSEPIVSAVDLLSCHKLVGTTEPFIFVIERGELIVEAITKLAETTQIKSAILTGLGGFDDPEIGYFDVPTKEFQYKKFEGFHEVGALDGNITTLNDEIIVHLHVVLGLRDYTALTGHLRNATVSITAEISVTPLRNKVVRRYNPYLKYNLITT